MIFNLEIGSFPTPTTPVSCSGQHARTHAPTPGQGHWRYPKLLHEPSSVRGITTVPSIVTGLTQGLSIH